MTRILLIAWALTALYSLTHPPRDLSAFDMRRCYALHQRLHCWPKRGVFMAGDRALAWQVVNLKEKR